MDKLKKRWGLQTNWDVLAVFIVFAINGSFAAYIGRPLMKFLQLSPETLNPFIYYPVRILIVFAIYQITLPMVGWLFGKYQFFYIFTKKFLSRMGMGFLFKEDNK